MKTNFRARIIFAVLVCAIGGFWWHKRAPAASPPELALQMAQDLGDEEGESDTETSQAAAGESASRPRPPAVPAAPPSSAGPSAQERHSLQERRSVQELAPSLAELKRDAERDPEGTPPSLVSFSLAIYHKLEAALTSEAKARSLLAELKTCVSQHEGVSLSVQSVCLLNARRLLSAYPSLSQEYRQIETDSDPRARRLISGLLTTM